MNARWFADRSLIASILAVTVAAVIGVTSLAVAALAPVIPSYQVQYPTQTGPAYVALDSQGNLYVTCYDANLIRKYDPFGNLLLEWGTPGNGPGQFNGPWGIAIDASDVVFVCDYGNNRIQKFTASGAFIAQFGGFPLLLPLNGPEGITIDNAGNVYVTEFLANRVQKFTNGGGFLLAFGSSGSGPSQFSIPDGIHVAANGTIYVADAGNNRVQYFGPTGTFLGQWGTSGTGDGQFSALLGIAGDELGFLYVADWFNNRIQKFSSSGVYLGQWGSTGTGNGNFNRPAGIALDGAGNVFIADYANNRIQKFSVTGAPPPNVPPTPFTFYGPGLSGAPQMLGEQGQLASDASGNVWVPQWSNNTVYKISSSGAYLGFVGGGVAGSNPGQFNVPFGVGVDGAGNIYVSDLNNHRIQKFSSTGTFLGQWGSLGSGPGQFTGPTGVDVDAAGNVWVCETVGRVQKFNSSGGFISSFPTAQGQDLQVGPDGNLYLLSPNSISVYSPAGTLLRSWSCPDGSTAMAVDAQGFVHTVGLGNVYRKYTNLGALVASMGPVMTYGPSLFKPYGLNIDVNGHLWISNSGFLVKAADPPLISQISDVANDQGRSVRVRFRRARSETPTTGPQVSAYAVYRKIEALPASAPAQSASVQPPAGINASQVTGWDFAGFMSPTGAASYELTVPTLANATPYARYYSSFMVRAVTNNALLHLDSGVEQVASIDNLAPPAVTPFTGTLSSGIRYLHWGISSAPDYAGYRLYKGASGFVPGPGNLVVATTDTGYVDNGAMPGEYKITAVDFDGNESPPTSLSLAQFVDVPEGGRPLVFALDGAHPSPTRASRLNVRFSLPNAAPARLEMFDVSGRRVASRDVGGLGAGTHVVNLSPSLNGTVRPGLYFLRLSQGAEDRRVRVTIVD